MTIKDPVFSLLTEMDEHLDTKIADIYKDQPLAQDWGRVAKVAEELGEAIAALIGYTGQNPRKGITHVQDDLLQELADVVMTALLAMQHFTKDAVITRFIVARKAQSIYDRMKVWEAEYK